MRRGAAGFVVVVVNWFMMGSIFSTFGRTFGFAILGSCPSDGAAPCCCTVDVSIWFVDLAFLSVANAADLAFLLD